jgi:hypothetical protein
VSLFEDRDEVEMLQMLQKLLGFEVFQVRSSLFNQEKHLCQFTVYKLHTRDA